MNGSPVQCLNFRGLAGRDQLSSLHEVFGPTINIRFNPLERDFDMKAELLILPGVSVLHGVNSPSVASRFDLSGENDDLELLWNFGAAKGSYTHLGREISNADGRAFLATRCENFLADMHSKLFHVNIRIARARLETLLPHAESVLMRPVPRSQPAFALLRAYVKLLRKDAAGFSPEMQVVAADHICDLVALTVGTTRDATAFAAGRGLKQARYAAVRQWAAEHLRDPSLSVESTARAHGMSVRYVQQLFAEHDTSFSKFVLRKRLELARRDLADPAMRNFSVSTIAFECGFGDLSHFNRSFRAIFGQTPSDARQQAVSS